MMDIEELKEEASLLSSLFPQKADVDYMSVEDYILATLGLEKSSIEKPEIFYKNFVHLMCHLYKDIKEIENRLADYRTRYTSIEKVKSNKAEFERRKLIYFCELNKEALREINNFIASGIPRFLSDHSYDTLNRECERDGLSDLFYRNRYMFAWHGIIVKVSQYAKEKCSFEQIMEEERRLLNLHSVSPEQFWNQMNWYIENDHVVHNILERVSNDYNLYK